MFNKIYEYIKKFIKENYKDIIGLVIFYIVLTFPVNYYIFVGGGISNIKSRVKVENGYKEKGSLNISYVKELKGTTLTYLLSYIIPDWKRDSIEEYKYEDNESLEDVTFRNNLDLSTANSRSIRIAYELAEKEYTITNTKIYITYVSNKYKSNLKVQDQLISIDDKTYNNKTDYQKYINSLNEGDIVKVKIIRDKKEKIVDTKIYKLEDKLILGVMLGEISEYKTNPLIKINFKNNESGPSGGLITTLSIYNQLTKKDITSSYKIAGTGTIEENHAIGEIGEIKYKLLGASREKADIFLTPSGDNYKTCVKVKKEKKLKIKIIEVKTIEDAIEKLNNLK